MSQSVVIDAGWAQTIGTRDYQQDTVMVMHWPGPFVLGVLADGMGGQTDGELASKESVRAFSEYFCGDTTESIPFRLSDALSAANNQLARLVDQQPSLSGMGTTLLAVASNGAVLHWISVGDSPCWLVRNTTITRINQDHGYKVQLNAQLARGEITLEERLTHRKRNQLLSAVVGREIADIDLNQSTLEVGDIVILASDGVETLQPEEVLAACIEHKQLNAKELAEHIIKDVKQRNIQYQDNATILILKFAG